MILVMWDLAMGIGVGYMIRGFGFRDLIRAFVPARMPGTKSHMPPWGIKHG